MNNEISYLDFWFWRSDFYMCIRDGTGEKKKNLEMEHFILQCMNVFINHQKRFYKLFILSRFTTFNLPKKIEYSEEFCKYSFLK